MQATTLSVKHSVKQSKWRRSTLIALAVCAVASFAARGRTLDGSIAGIAFTPAALLTLAVAFALVAIVTARVASFARAEAQAHALFAASQLAALGIGATGTLAAWTTGDWQRGVLFALAGGIFSLRSMVLKTGT